MNFNAERVNPNSLQSYFTVLFLQLNKLNACTRLSVMITGAPTFRDLNISWQAMFVNIQEALICAMTTLHLIITCK